MKVQIILFYAPWSEKRIFAEAIFFKDHIQIKDSENSLHWPINSFYLEFSGSKGNLLFFKNKSNPEECFYIEEEKSLIQFLKENLTSHDHQEILKKRSFEKLKSLFFVALFFLLFIGPIVLFWANKEEISKNIVEKIPYDIEKTIGEKIFALNLPPSKLYQNEEALNLLNEVLLPLRETIPSPYNKFKVFISNDMSLNAFAMPGGYMIFNLGTLKNAEHELEILGVAAHELAHVQKRHVLKGIIQGLGIFTFFQVFIGDISGFLGILVDQGHFLIRQKFSREFEEEADRIGFDFLVDAKINPLGLKSFFMKLENQKEADNKVLDENIKKINTQLELFSTHPDTLKRIEKIENLYNNLDDDVKQALRESNTSSFLDLKNMLGEL